MRWSKKTLRRAFLSLAAVAAAACVVAPLVRADRFGGRIRQALERSLDLKVEMTGPVRFRLLAGPGFAADNVIIYGDPAISIEPLAYVTSLELAVRLRSLLRGHLEFSNLRLIEPSVNLVKSKAGPWHFPPLFDRAFDESQVGGIPLPGIQVRSARLNFRFGDTKSVYYFSNADVDVSPAPGQVQALDVRFSGEPARTDRSAQGFGGLVGSGRWFLSRDEDNRVELDLRLERSAIAEVMTLLRGQGMGLNGFVASRARLQGPVSNIAIAGRLRLADIDRWPLARPQGGERSLDYQGSLNLKAQTLELGTAPSEEPVLPVVVRFHASDYLSQPRWAMTVTFEQLPLDSLPALAREMRIRVPEGALAQGSITGALSYSSPGRLEGRATIEQAAIGVSGSTPVQFEEATLVVEDGGLRIAPARIVFAGRQSARVQARYQPGSGTLDVQLSTPSLSVSRFRSAWQELIGTPLAPVLASCRSGSYSGSVRYLSIRGSPTQWIGNVMLRNARIALAGFADPLRIASASVALSGERVEIKSMDASLGDVDVRGDFSYDVKGARPHGFHLVVPELEATELERLLMPALRHRRRGLLARTLGLRPAPPDWLKTRRVEGTVRVEELAAPGVLLESLKAKVRWDGTDLRVVDLESRLRGATLTGRISADLSQAQPAYEAEARIKGLPWAGGRINAEGRLKTAGAGAKLLVNASAEGSFDGRSIRLGPDSEWRSVSGRYELSMVRGLPHLLLMSIELSRDAEKYYGRGSSSPDGRILIQLSNETTEMEMAGTLIPLRLELKRP